jgi:hypothetical protein
MYIYMYISINMYIYKYIILNLNTHKQTPADIRQFRAARIDAKVSLSKVVNILKPNRFLSPSARKERVYICTYIYVYIYVYITKYI